MFSPFRILACIMNSDSMTGRSTARASASRETCLGWEQVRGPGGKDTPDEPV